MAVEADCLVIPEPLVKNRHWTSRHLPAVMLFGLILLWRLAQVQHLALPAWVDSVHHALLVRLLLEQGQIPATWAPYLPDVPFYYHFGFHLTAAAVTVLTGLNVGQSVLLAGQVWQAAMAPGVYLLSLTIWKDRLAALMAMLLVGFVSQMPAYATTWGRYTLLAGLVLLSLALAAAIAGRPLLLAGLTAAIAITHYYTFLLLLLFVAIRLVVPGGGKRQVVWGSVAGVLLASPWLIWVLWQALNRRLLYVAAGPQSADYTPEYMAYLLGPARNYVLLALALMGLVIVIRRVWQNPAAASPGLIALLVWSGLLIAFLGPWRLGPFRPDLHAALVIFLPAVLFAGAALRQMRRPLLGGLVIAVLVVWGIIQTRDIVNPATILATPADVTALDWVAANTPPQAVFLIDVAPWESQWRGADGGWWITPLTGRPTVIPPAVYGWGSPALVDRFRALGVRIYALRQADNAVYCQRLAAVMADAGAMYYYTRSPRPEQCAGLQPVYQQSQGVFIYRSN